jgi:signal transduction histidine kinase
MRRQGRTDFRVEGSLDTSQLPSTVQAVVLRVVRELLLNAYKHAGASMVTVKLVSAATRQTISVSDDGQGIDRSGSKRAFGPDGGFGLASAEAQMQAIGGRLCLESKPDCGTTASLTLPGQRRPAATPRRRTVGRGAQGASVA